MIQFDSYVSKGLKPPARKPLEVEANQSLLCSFPLPIFVLHPSMLTTSSHGHLGGHTDHSRPKGRQGWPFIRGGLGRFIIHPLQPGVTYCILIYFWWTYVMTRYVMLCYVMLCDVIWCYVTMCYNISMSNEVDLWRHAFKSGDIKVVLVCIFVFFVRMPFIIYYEFYCQYIYFMNSYIDIIVVIPCEIMVQGFILVHNEYPNTSFGFVW